MATIAFRLPEGEIQEIELYQRLPCPLALCISVVGRRNRVAGELLHQLHFRFVHQSALRFTDGHWWVAQPARCWMSECAMSKNHLGRAVKVLSDLALIEVIQRPIQPHNPVRITHIRLTERAFELLSPLRGPRGEKDAPDGPDTRKSSSWFSAGRRVQGRGTKGTQSTEQNLEGRGRAVSRTRAGECRVEARGGAEEEPKGRAERMAVFERSEFDEVLETRSEGYLEWRGRDNLVELVRSISSRSDQSVPRAHAKNLLAYRELAEAFYERAHDRWKRDRSLPMPIAAVLELVTTKWLDYMREFRPENDMWPFPFNPRFALYKAEHLYDWALEMTAKPPSLEERGWSTGAVPRRGTD